MPNYSSMSDYGSTFATVRAGNHLVRFPSGMSAQAIHNALTAYYGPGNQQIPESVSSYDVGQPKAAPQDAAGKIAAQPIKNTSNYLFSQEGLFAHGDDGTVTHVVKS